MTIGNDWAYRDYLFPGYPLSNTGDAEYAQKVRLSAFDMRVERKLDIWNEWDTVCADKCGQNQIRTRTRDCECPTDSAGGPQNCFDCALHTYEEEDCPYRACEFSKG